ncbi:hypothetical protein D770_13260 [Flammeovirgaceae bacterium 311]|nr:hypothetical protein D770_13260 [Flammeovirgaceae bacterium 311]
MKYIILLACLLFSCIAFAQDTLLFEIEKNTGLIVGYSYNFGDMENKNRADKKFHFLELGIWRTTMARAYHPVTTGYYFSNEFGLNTNSFVYGPKIGGFIAVLVLGGGCEFVYYTNFEEGSLRFVPYMGLCTHLFKLTINPHIIITNKDFEGLNRGHLNLSIRFASLKKDIQKFKDY